MFNFEALILKAKKNPKRVRIVVACAEEEHIFLALQKCMSDFCIELILIGERNIVSDYCNRYFESKDSVEIINASGPEEATRFAVQLIRDGKADVLMKGKLSTSTLLHGVVDKQEGIRTGKVMSHIAFLEHPGYKKMFSVTDSGMLLYPDLEAKKELIKNAIAVYHSLGVACPKVACLAASEVINSKIHSSQDAADLKIWQQQGGIDGCIVEGPISYDLAMDETSVEQKEYQSPVAADADILVVPDLVCGNVMGKALTFTGHAKMAGIVVGAQVPIIVTSRGASEEEKYLSIIIAMLAS